MTKRPFPLQLLCVKRAAHLQVKFMVPHTTPCSAVQHTCQTKSGTHTTRTGVFVTPLFSRVVWPFTLKHGERIPLTLAFHVQQNGWTIFTPTKCHKGRSVVPTS